MIKQGVTKQQIFDKINEFHLFKRYAPEFTIGKMFKGDIGRTKLETHPSANIYFSPKGLRYTDFGVGTFDAIAYIMAKFNLSFKDTLEKIDIDFNLNIGYYGDIRHNTTKYNYTNIVIPESIQKSRRIIRIKTSKWIELDLIYWQSNGWTQSMLERAKIKSIEAYFIDYGDGVLNRYSVKNELAYSYDYYTDEDDIFQRKLYMPNRTKGKWISNINNMNVQNWHLFPKSGKICFITSSYKDGGAIWQLYNKPIFIAPTNEVTFLPTHIIKKIKQRYKEIVIFFDNDEAGINNAKKFSKKYNINYIHLPIGEVKDIAEFVDKYSIRQFKTMLKNILINKNIKHYL